MARPKTGRPIRICTGGARKIAAVGLADDFGECDGETADEKTDDGETNEHDLNANCAPAARLAALSGKSLSERLIQILTIRRLLACRPAKSVLRP